MSRTAIFAFALVLTCLGCSKPESVLQGGTSGALTLRGAATADLQVNIFTDEPSPRRVGFGVTDTDGLFTLITDDGQEALTLDPGKYRITVESVAADPIPLPQAVTNIRTTPIRHAWTLSDGELVLKID